MKKILFLISLIAGTLSVSAQSYKAVKVDIGLGYAFPTGGGSGAKAGVTFTVEPHYRLSDDLAVGFRFEGAALGYENLDAGSNSSVKVSVLTSYCATGEYYLSAGSFRPFAGAGLGFFNSADIKLDSSTGSKPLTVPGESKFGFFPRVGFETGHFRVSGEYNIISEGGYIAAKIGFFFGGGKK